MRLGPSLLVVSLSACAPTAGGPEAPGPAASTVAPSGSASTRASAPAPTQPTSPPKASAAPPASASAPPRAEPATTLGLEDAKRWLAREGVGAASSVDQIVGCRETRVGDPARPGLFCVGNRGPMAGSFPSGESVFPLRILVVERGSLRVALEVPLSAGALDRDVEPDPGDPNEGSYVLLEAFVEDDGKAVVVREKQHPKARCATVLASLDKSLARHRKMVELACRSAGTYRWQAGRFVRAAERPSGGSGTSL